MTQFTDVQNALTRTVLVIPTAITPTITEVGIQKKATTMTNKPRIERSADESINSAC